MTNAWRDRIAGDRMAVDREFADEVRASDLNRQEWGLVMTAVELRIENASDPETARLVADTSKLPHVMSEMESLREARPGPGGASGPTGGGDGGGLLDALRGALGLGGGGGDAARRAEAERLAENYAGALQARLEERGRWATICSLAADEAAADERDEPS